MKQYIAHGMLVLAAALLAFGCDSRGTDPVAPPGNEPLEAIEVIDLDSPTGGLAETNEQIAFGEPEAFAFLAEEAEYDDPLQGQEQIRNLERRDGVRIYRLRALWGRVLAAQTDSVDNDCCPLDWSGGMHLEGGVIVVERVIHFEEDDYIRRTAPGTIRWVSQTCAGFDGVQVRLIVPPVVAPDSTGGRPDSTSLTTPVLTIRTGPFSRRFTLRELEKLELLEPVDRCNNYMSINSHRLLPGCPSGHLMGRWLKAAEPDTLVDPETGARRGVVLGHYRGMWFSERGAAVGYVRGFYGLSNTGERRFFGKYINMSGEFMGLIAGNWGIDSNEILAAAVIERGWFEGLWYGRRRAALGRLKGEWITGEADRGYFKGIWARNCGEAE